MHATYYVAPVMFMLEAVVDDTCSDRSAFDIGWSSEFDPTWDDDELAMIKMPIAFAFGSLPGILAAGPDAAAAAIGFPMTRCFGKQARGDRYTPWAEPVKTTFLTISVGDSIRQECWPKPMP